MDEKTTHDGRTAMERLAWRLMYAVCDFADASRSWCKKNNVDLRGANRSLCMELAHYDIERRIYEARREDMETFKALRNARAELEALYETGRVMPEDCKWPRYTDGGQVRIGDEMVDGIVHEVSVTAGGCSLTGSDGSLLAEVPNWVLIHRPDPKAIGADGREVKVGDTVWLAPEYRDMAGKYCVDSGGKCSMHGVGRFERLEVDYVSTGCSVIFTANSAWCPASWLTHERPDSWERLHGDARKGYAAYWGCIGFCCNRCPVLVDGINPAKRYSTANYHNAMGLDLVARAERLAGVQGE